MLKIELKQWIQNTLVKSTGNLEVNYLRPTAKIYVKSPYILESIMLYTSHNPSAKMTQKIYDIMNDIVVIPLCKICNVSPRIFKSYIDGYSNCCNNAKCFQNDPDTQLRRKRNVSKSWEKEGERVRRSDILSSVWIDKSDRTSHAKRGGDTKFNNHGDRRYNNPEAISNSYKNQTLEQSTSRKNRRRVKLIANTFYKHKPYYDSSSLLLIDTVETYTSRAMSGDKRAEFKCKKCEAQFLYPYNYNGYAVCRNCHPYTYSVEQVKLSEFLSQYIDCKMNDRTVIKPYEIDILTDSFGIEYNGIMWHSFGIMEGSMRHNNHMMEKDNKNNHLDKTNLCEEQGLQLFHIFENEWCDITKKEIWKSMLMSKINKTVRIYARSCSIREVSADDSKVFLDLNHMQGSCNSTVKLGLYYNEDLISIMTFSKSRYNKSFEWELIRFATKLNHTVIGGASKLLKAFERIYTPKSLMSYANRRWSQGNVYEKLGFEFKYKTDPNYFYFHKNDGIMQSRQIFQKHMLTHFPSYSDDKTETQIMYEEGYRKIYDSGNLVYIKEYK